MKLEVGDNQGYVIVDDNTGNILDIFIQLDENKFDNYIISSYHRVGYQHFKTE